MTLPFNTEQFFAVFAAYNAAIWPMQIAVYGLGIVAGGSLFTGHPARKRLILAILSVMWAWNGIAYQFAFFSSINPAALGFAALFVAQAALFAICAVVVSDLSFQFRFDGQSIVGVTLIIYAVLIYEILGVIAGHGLMKGPLFGVAPCPTTIFTIGMLLLARGRSVAWLSLIPIIWTFVGGSAAVLLTIPEDFGLAIAGFALVVRFAAEWHRHGHA